MARDAVELLAQKQAQRVGVPRDVLFPFLPALRRIASLALPAPRQPRALAPA
jgi:hypothetical protein